MNIDTKCMYHWKCLVNLYSTDAGYRVAQDKDCEAQLHGIALTKLVAHMEDLQKEVSPVFK